MARGKTYGKKIHLLQRRYFCCSTASGQNDNVHDEDREKKDESEVGPPARLPDAVPSVNEEHHLRSFVLLYSKHQDKNLDRDC